MAYAALGGLKQFFKSNAEAIDISNATFTLAKFVSCNHYNSNANRPTSAG